MSAPSDIEALEQRLAMAERQLECARMIDHWPRARREVAYWQERVDSLRAEIDRADPFSPHGSGPVPIEPRQTPSTEEGENR